LQLEPARTDAPDVGNHEMEKGEDTRDGKEAPWFAWESPEAG
jgi:hypothetical protein